MKRNFIRHTAGRVRHGEESALQVVENAIRNHESSDLGAYIVFDPDGARTQAAAIDRAVARGDDPGPLAGVTVSVKDLYPGFLTPIREHRSPGDVKFMYGMNLTRFPTEDRCPHTVSPFPWHFKGARVAG